MCFLSFGGGWRLKVKKKRQNTLKYLKYIIEYMNLINENLQDKLHDKINNMKLKRNKKCPHDREKSKCKECGGSSICPHDKIKTRCRICDPQIHPGNWCSNCKYVLIINSNYKPYCFNCFCVLNPDIEIKRQFKLKEHYLNDALKEEYKNINLVFDQKVDDGCSLRRPDVRIECYTHSIIIECDENKHQGYSCENKRTMQLFQDLGNRPIVFLRFNPDSYKRNNKIIEGCFNKNKINELEWNKRINKLKKYINFYLTTIPTKEIEIEELFY